MAGVDMAQDLVSLREEEKLARDVYRTLHGRWPIPPFANILEAEQRHFDRVGMLLSARRIADPVASDAIGTFTAPRFAALFRDLVARGEVSTEEALRVGALIEELDIVDIEAMRARTEDSEARQVYDLLECGSRNHLRAFTGLLAAEGASYSPEHLSPDRYLAISEGEQERCGRMSGGGGGRDQRGWRR